MEVIEELDASGGDAKRPGWNRALEMVESGEVRAVVVWNLARFTRSVRDFLEAWDRIEAADARVVSASEDLSNKLYRVIMAAVAEQERDRARDNFAAATASAVERGITLPGRFPSATAGTPTGGLSRTQTLHRSYEACSSAGRRVGAGRSSAGGRGSTATT